MKLLVILMAALLLFCVSGCGTSEHANADEDDHHHLEHFVPHHKPANFKEAVSEISHRSEHLSQHAGHGHDDGDEFNELLDIVDWIPELAADSDLSEADWNKAVAAATAIKTKLQARKLADGTLTLEKLPDAMIGELKALEGLIAAAGKPEKRIDHDHDHDHDDHEHDDHDHDK